MVEQVGVGNGSREESGEHCARLGEGKINLARKNAAFLANCEHVRTCQDKAIGLQETSEISDFKMFCTIANNRKILLEK